jgi:hypothetical protein
LIGAGVFLELGKGNVEGELGVLAGLGLFLEITGNGSLNPGVAGKTDEQQHYKREHRERDEQRKTVGAPRTRRTLRAES